jgi:hypothetical protein
LRLLAGACGLVTLLALASAAVAQQAPQAQGGKSSFAAQAIPEPANPSASPASKKGLAANPAKPSEVETAVPNTPNKQGIKVHGHWLLVVKNPDGSVSDHREFENDLVAPSPNANADGFLSGNQLLGLLLSGSGVPGDPAVVFVSAPSGKTLNPPPTYYDCAAPAQATCDAVYTNNSGLIYGLEIQGVSHFATASQGLTSTVNLSPAINWVLNGNFQVQAASSHSMSYVLTMIPLCVTGSITSPPADYSYLASNTIGGWENAGAGAFSGGTGQLAPNACNWTTISGSGVFPALAQFTYTAIPGGPLITVTGQVITVTVTVSFS